VPTWLMMRTVTFVSVLVAVLVAFAIAGFVAWWVPVAALVVWALLPWLGTKAAATSVGKSSRSIARCTMTRRAAAAVPSMISCTARR
jgi:hypothetical protein